MISLKGDGNTSMKKKILCVGHCVLDRVYHVENMPRAAQKMDALTSRESGGGPASTAAVAIAKLGGEVAFVGHLGDDDAGRTLCRKLNEQQVNIKNIIIIEGFRTIAPVVLVDQTGERCIIVHRHPVSVPEERMHFDLNKTDCLLVDTRWIPGAKSAIQAAKTLNIPIVIDVDGGDRQSIFEMLPFCEHVIFSDQGLNDCTDHGDIETRLRKIQQLCTGIVAVTSGQIGSYWLINDRLHHVPAFSVTSQDTTGCGDVFHGAYALTIAEGMAPLQAARFASAAAALKAKNGNGWDGMPRRADVDLLARSIPL